MGDSMQESMLIDGIPFQKQSIAYRSHNSRGDRLFQLKHPFQTLQVVLLKESRGGIKYFRGGPNISKNLVPGGPNISIFLDRGERK